jgi:hypothetical protein
MLTNSSLLIMCNLLLTLQTSTVYSLWIEPESMSKPMISKISKMKGVGLAVNVLKIDDYIKKGAKMNSFKLSYKDYDVDDPKEVAKTLNDEEECADSVVVSSMNEAALEGHKEAAKERSLSLNLDTATATAR